MGKKPSNVTIAWGSLGRDIKYFYTKLRDERNHIFMSSFPDIKMWDITQDRLMMCCRYSWRFCIVRDGAILLTRI